MRVRESLRDQGLHFQTTKAVRLTRNEETILLSSEATAFTRVGRPARRAAALGLSTSRETPATGAKEMEFLEQEFGYEDKAPVFCEPFFTHSGSSKTISGNGRLALEKVDFFLLKRG